MLKNTLGNSFLSQQEVGEILSVSARLRYILAQHYQVHLAEIVSVHLDTVNHKLDIDTQTHKLRFKAKGTKHVLRTDPVDGHLVMTLDPALAQGIYTILDEFGQP